MKKIIIICLLTLASFSLFAKDITVKLEDGKTAVLHDNGTWEYLLTTNNNFYGTWIFTEDSLDYILDMALASEGVYPGDGMYELTIAIIKESFMQELYDLFDMKMVIEEDALFLYYGEDAENTTYVQNNDTQILVNDDASSFIVTFNEDYTEATFLVEDMMVKMFKE